MEIHKIIRKPLLTEKSLHQVSSGKYTFEVDLKANKREVSKAIEIAFGVNVRSIRTSILKGKRIRLRGRVQEKKGPIIKKAIVTLTPGQKISAFDVGK